MQQLLNGIKEGWRADRLKYDIRHFMANFSMMVAADKASYLFRLFICYVSDAIYKMLPNEADRVAILEAMGEGDPFFQKVRSNLVVGLYNQKDLWPIFGYEGASADKGGYIERGFDDIGWV